MKQTKHLFSTLDCDFELEGEQMKRKLLLLFLPLFWALFANGQGSKAASFGASETHEYDSIDLATLIPTWQFPVISKTGAIPFRLSITVPQTCSIDVVGSLWGCGSRFGGNGDGMVSFNTSLVPGARMTASSFVSANGACPQIHVTALIDPNSGYHAVTPVIIGGSSPCSPTTASVLTTDGSHISATVTGQYGFAPSVSNITFANGYTTGSLGGPYSITDTFGNVLSDDGSTITDTLGTSTLKYSSSGYSYVDANGATQPITFTLGSNVEFDPYNDGLCNVSNGGASSVTPITAINYPDGTSFGIGWDNNVNNPGTKSGLIGSVTLPTGGTISYTYGMGAIGSCTTPKWWFSNLTRTTPDGQWTYSSTGTVTTVVDPGKNKTVYTFVNANPGCSGIYCVLVPVISQIQKFQNTNTVASPMYALVSTDSYCYNTVCNGGTFTYPVTQRDVYHYVDTSSFAMSHTTELYDSYGNVTSNTAVELTTNPNQTLVTTTTFSGCGQGSTINDHPCDIKTVNGANTVAETQFTYDAAGALKQKKTLTSIVAGVSNWLTTGYTPNTNGTIGSVTDPNNQVYNYTYGACNSLLSTSTSTIVGGTSPPITLTTSQTWDCNSGLVIDTTDSNGNEDDTTYDSMLRIKTHNDRIGDGNTTTFAYGTPTLDYVLVTDPLGVQRYQYNDGLGRPTISQVRQGPSSSNYDTVSKTYGWKDSGGHALTNFQTTTSVPCSTTLGASCPTVAVTSLANPVRGFISSTDVNTGTQKAGYKQNDTSIAIGTSPKTFTAQTEVDGFGREKSGCSLESTGGTSCGQAMGNSGILTASTYSYGSGSSMITTARGQQTHSETFDALGRLTQVMTPESGTVNNVYDAATGSTNPCFGTSPGDLAQTTDNSGDETCFYYDGFHRVFQEYTATSPSTIVNCRNFSYGDIGIIPPSGITVTNGYERLVNANVVSDCSGNTVSDEWFSYDADGRMTDMWESTPHSGGYYHTTVVYDANGTVTSISGIPGYSALTFTLDGEGRQNAAKLGSLVVIPASPGVTFDAAGKVLSIPIGSNGDLDTYTYDGLEQPTNYTFSVNGKSMSGTLTQNPDGTLKQLAITDTFNSGGAQTCTFTYDDVARMITDNCGSVWNMPITNIDQYDNITKSDWNFSYNPANNQMQGGPTYDSNGRVKYDTVNTYAWNGYGMMTAVRAGNSAPSCGSSGSFCVTYDAFGRMVETQDGSTYTEILYSPVGRLARMSGQTTTEEAVLPLPGGASLKTTNNGGSARVFMHKDWLGTARLGTNFNTRGFTWDTAYAPYSESYDTFGTLKQNFTGDLQDVFAGLFDTPNRELMQNSGRWLSPDPAHASWNAYSYPTNPNRMTDPSGLDPSKKDPCAYDACVVATPEAIPTLGLLLPGHFVNIQRFRDLRQLQRQQLVAKQATFKRMSRYQRFRTQFQKHAWKFSNRGELRARIEEAGYGPEQAEYMENRAMELLYNGSNDPWAQATGEWTAMQLGVSEEAAQASTNQAVLNSLKEVIGLGPEEGSASLDLFGGAARGVGSVLGDVAGPAAFVLGTPTMMGRDWADQGGDHIGVNHDANMEGYWNKFEHLILNSSTLW